MRIAPLLTCLVVLTAMPSVSLRAEMKEDPMEEQDMKGELGLTVDQAAQLKSARESQRAAMKPLLDAQQGLRKRLEDQVRSKASDAELQATLNEMKSNRMAMRNLTEEFLNRREGMVTPTQRAKMILRRPGPEKREKMRYMREMKKEKAGLP
ncbi:MAG: hypothetical protein A2992_06200 [Elusimicrobia bacterium RIFCSPLOWO2_01_FULL_59_12]|nr:MAG: hypothetical protein A2992_06200 [Elusimicrobia bacterium RIFCSPLOWO2_01_FULL_59_12]